MNDDEELPEPQEQLKQGPINPKDIPPKRRQELSAREQVRRKRKRKEQRKARRRGR